MHKSVTYVSFIGLLLLLSCKQNKINPPEIAKVDTSKILVDSITKTQAEEEDEGFNDRGNYQDSPLKLIASYPTIKDTAAFIKELKANCHIWTRKAFQKYVTINYFKRTKLYGYNDFVYIIEYDYKSGCSAEFPYKNQYVFNSSGKLLAILREMRLDIVKIFPDEHPFLVGVSSTGHGNGGHEVYRMRKDTLEQVYDGFMHNRLQTYNTSGNYVTNVPDEFSYAFSDVDGDGYNDIIFSGKVKHENPATAGELLTKIKFIFLYHPSNGHFIEKEDYEKKYEFIYGKYE